MTFSCGVARRMATGRRSGGRALLALALALGAWKSAAVHPAAVAQERAELAQQRRLLLDALAKEERECRERFAVTACQDDVRRRRRDALQPIRERELRLEEAERRARASERRAAVAARQASAAVPQPAAAASQPVLRVRPERRTRAAAQGPQAAASAPPRRAAASASQAQASREDAAAARARAAERRQEQAEATRARIEQRQAQREASGRRSDPLPPATAAPASGAR